MMHGHVAQLLSSINLYVCTPLGKIWHAQYDDCDDAADDADDDNASFILT